MTAVEELHLYFAKSIILLGEKGWELILKIKELEKQQIKDAYNQGFRDGQKNWDIILKNDIKECSNSENYYNETFNK
jgi:hypothetical protein